jgi:hypothetical protein
MISFSQIPLFKHIETNEGLPNVYFGEMNKKHSKKYPFLYSSLSKMYFDKILKSNNYYVSFDTFQIIKNHIDKIEVNDDTEFKSDNTNIFTLTIPSSIKEIYNTYVFISTKIKEGKIIDILTYGNINLSNWLSGVLYNKNDIHISVSYNLIESDISFILSLYNSIIKLKSLNYFEQVPGKANNHIFSHNKNTISADNLIHLDLSNIREYLIPSIVRREHYRWQFCGPGRSILRKVKVQSTLVKSHTRKGKRL